VPLSLELEKTRVHDFDREKLVALFGELNFYSLVKRIPKSNNANLQIDANAESNIGVKDFKYEEADEKNQDEFWKEISEQKKIALVIDSLGENSKPEIRGMAFSWKAGRVFYLKYFKETFEKVKKILEDENVKKIGYDFKIISKIFSFYGVQIKGIYFDEMVAAYAIDPGSKIEFNKLVMMELGEEIAPEENKSGQLSMMIDDNFEQKRIEIISRKADYVFKLKSVLLKKIKEISE